MEVRKEMSEKIRKKFRKPEDFEGLQERKLILASLVKRRNGRRS